MQFITATFVINKCKFLTILMPQKFALFRTNELHQQLYSLAQLASRKREREREREREIQSCPR